MVAQQCETLQHAATGRGVFLKIKLVPCNTEPYHPLLGSRTPQGVHEAKSFVG